ncbi:MAG: GNAT family N-acetyltransferase [Oscillospiraceae bacterium]|jgi:ribosomal protein S18 acetylase RimI-like enzyme|nr:GNAT family N-acetyltransferase [Oscillospiraceae bacterium]
MRDDILIREARIRDAHHIKRLWQRVFNDTDEVIGAFFEVYIDVRLCVLAQIGGRLAGLGLLLPVGDFVAPAARNFNSPTAPDLNAPPSATQCAMLYALATEPEFRGLGCASLITRELLRVGKKHGFGVVVLRPASDALFDFYGKNGFCETFYCREYTVKASELKKTAQNAPGIALTRASPEEYLARRELLLRGVAHIAFDRRALAFQARLSPGGGLFFAGDGCAAVETAGQPGGRVLISELLGADEGAIIAAVADAFPANEYLVRAPAREAEYEITRFGMSSAETAGAYMGFTFG